MVKRKKRVKPVALPSREQEIFQKFDRYIGENLAADLRFEDIEKKMSMSYSNLYRIVKSETGKSIKQYVLDRKIEKAGDLLRTTNKNIAEIMLDVGFNNAGHFSALFKKHTGLSPTQYRDKSRT
jgi:two-component system response regulator YesN